jgi:hypothetical protein
MTAESENEHTVGHIGLACYLWFRGHALLRTEWRDQMCRWTFQRTETFKEDMDSFFKGQAQVDPREFFPKVTEFKRAMYREKPDGEEDKDQTPS